MSRHDARDADVALAAYRDRLVASGLEPFMTLPRQPEPPRRVRARMAELISRRVSATESITREDLRGGGFTSDQIDQHFDDAVRIAGVSALAT